MLKTNTHDRQYTQSFGPLDLVLRRTFPNKEIVWGTKSYDLVVRSHFHQNEPSVAEVPYITWSGEPFEVKPSKRGPPILQIGTT